MRGVPILLVFVSVLALAIGGIFAQSPPRKEPPRVEFSDLGNDWLRVDQVGDGSALAIKRTSLHAIAYHDPTSKYARTVYNETGVYLVVFNIGAAEYRVRCPTKERAAELLSFLTGDKIDGER